MAKKKNQKSSGSTLESAEKLPADSIEKSESNEEPNISAAQSVLDHVLSLGGSKVRKKVPTIIMIIITMINDQAQQHRDY